MDCEDDEGQAFVVKKQMKIPLNQTDEDIGEDDESNIDDEAEENQMNPCVEPPKII